MRTDELRIAFALLAATISLLLVGAGARAEAATPATGAVIDGVQLQDGAVTFSVTVPSAPVGTQLDPTRTSVTIGGVEALGRSSVLGEVGTVPAVVLVLDASGSMRGAALAAAKQAATSFVGALPAAVPVGLVTFADTASVEVPPTTNRGRITAAVASITASGDTALYDAIAAAAAVDADAKTLVVLSDGGDTASAADLTAVVTQVAASGSRVEAIALRTDEFDLAPLTSIAAAGHGTVRTVEDGAGLAAAFASTTASLSSRLDVVAFVPQDVGGEVDVAVAVRSGTSEWSGTTRVQLPVAVDAGPPVDEAPAAAPPTPVTVPASDPVLLWVLVGAIVLAVAMMVLAVAPRPKTDRQRRTAALAAYTVTGVPRGALPEPAAGPNPFVRQMLDASEKVVDRSGSSSATGIKLDRAGMGLRPHEWLIMQVGTCLAIAAVVALLTGWIVRAVLLGALLGWAGTALYLRWRQNRRTNRFADDLPDTLQLVASSLQTGFSLPQALDSAQGGATDAMAGELGRALAATRIGSELEDELDRVGVRMRSEDWKWAVMAVRIQRQVGGNLAEVLLTTVQTLRERAATRRQVRALSAEGKLSAYILIALPVGLFLFLAWVRPEYIGLLWTTLPGVVMLGPDGDPDGDRRVLDEPSREGDRVMSTVVLVVARRRPRPCRSSSSPARP